MHDQIAGVDRLMAHNLARLVEPLFDDVLLSGEIDDVAEGFVGLLAGALQERRQELLIGGSLHGVQFRNAFAELF